MNNLEDVLRMMDFSDPDKFYTIEILQRKKDLPDLERSIRLIQTYTVSSEEGLRKLFPEIQLMCDTFRARAYMYINRRSRKAICRAMLKTLADRIYSDEYHGLKHVFTSECGKHSAGDKLWIMDIDPVKGSFAGDYKSAILIAETYRGLIKNLMPDGDKLIGILPTKTGFHILTTAFDLRTIDYVKEDLIKYAEKLGYHIDCELKKDGMVNLYIPDAL